MVRKPTYDREDVLQKALNLFWSKGYLGTSLKDLEAGLNMRPGSIYAAFGSKEGLFQETLARYAAQSADRLADTLEDAESPLQGLADHVRALASPAAMENPARACMLVKTVLEGCDDDPAPRDAAEALMQGVEQSFAQAFQSAKEAGEIDEASDTEHLASWLQMQIFGLRSYAQRSDAEDKIELLAEGIALSVESLREPA